MERDVSNNKLIVSVIIGALVCAQFCFSQEDRENELYLSNLDAKCLWCLCHAATNCNQTFGCVQGYCGPYKVSRVYWIDAGRPVFNEDDPERFGSFEDCANNYHCAQKIVKGYLKKFAKDCNDDGVTDCDDFLMLNFNGGYSCKQPMNHNENARNWTQRYRICNPKQ